MDYAIGALKHQLAFNQEELLNTEKEITRHRDNLREAEERLVTLKSRIADCQAALEVLRPPAAKAA